MNIYLMRHAQTLINQKGKVFCGITETELSEEGKEMCRNISSLDIWSRFDKVYISNLKRTYDTANLIFDNKPIKVVVIPEFAELNFGDYEGKIMTKENKDDPIFQQWVNNCESLTFPNGENLVEHTNACYEKLKEIVNNDQSESILIISHSTTIRTLLTKILNIDINSFRRIPCYNGHLTKVKYDDNGFSLEYLNTPLDSSF